MQLLLHCTGAVPLYGAFYGESSKPVLLAGLSCSGSELDLLSCNRNTFGVTECSNYEEAGVICLGKFKTIHILRTLKCTNIGTGFEFLIVVVLF